MALLRSEYPLVLLLPSVMFGQIMALWFRPQAALVAIMPMMIAWLLGGPNGKRGALAALLLIVTAGYMLGLIGVELQVQPSIQPGATQPINSDDAVSAIVEEAPRRRHPGAASLSLLLKNGRRILCDTIELPWRNSSGLDAGDNIVFRASYTTIPLAPRSFADAALLWQGYSARCRIKLLARQLREQSSTDLIRHQLIADIETSLGRDESTALLLSLVLGARDQVSVRTERAFQHTGLSHLLVFSGAQVTIFYSILVWLLSRPFKQFWWGKPAASLIALAPCLVLILVVGVDRSSARAGLAALAAGSSIVFERGQGMGHAMLIALLGIILLWPCSFLEVGVQLTFAALIGLFLGNRITTGSWQRALAASFMASLSTSMVSAIRFGSFSIIGFLINPIMAPLVGILSCHGGLAALVSLESGLDPHGRGLHILACIVSYLRDAVFFLSELPWAWFELSSYEQSLVACGFAAIVAYAGYASLRLNWIDRGLILERVLD